MTLSKSENLKAIDAKFCTIDKVAEVSGRAKNYNNRLHGEPHTNAKYNVFECFLVFFCVLIGSRTAGTESRTVVNDSSKTCFPYKKCLFGSR